MLHRYFHKTLCLTQFARPDRWQQFEAECKRVSLHAERFYSVAADQAYISFCNSQIALLKCFLDSGDETLLAFEDDVLIKPYWHFDEAMKEIPDWEVLFLGCNPHRWEPHGTYTRRIYSAWTTHAVAYKRPAVEKIVQMYRGWEFHNMYDAFLADNILPNVKAYCIYPFVAVQRPVFSDLWGHLAEYDWDGMEKRMA